MQGCNTVSIAGVGDLRSQPLSHIASSGVFVPLARNWLSSSFSELLIAIQSFGTPQNTMAASPRKWQDNVWLVWFILQASATIRELLTCLRASINAPH
jgi:hypothetical protein